MERDNIIDSKISELTEKKNRLESTLASIKKFKTNLTVRTRTEVFNFRTCTNINDVFRGYMMLYCEWNAIEDFNKLISSVDVSTKVNPSFHGFTREEWEDDIKNLCLFIESNEKLAKVNAALKDLEKFYSGDRKEKNAFDSLLANIDTI